jgi:hypothetical protein
MDGKLCQLVESGGKGEGLHSSLDELECGLGGCLSDIVKEDGCSFVGCSSSRDSDDVGCSHEGRWIVEAVLVVEGSQVGCGEHQLVGLVLEELLWMDHDRLMEETDHGEEWWDGSI